MGVMGLTTFVSRNNGPGNRCYLRDVSLVVDGSSLAAQLYCNSAARKHASFNGDYSLIETVFYKFFNSLRLCGIECYVICDGGYDKRKMNTAIERLQSRIRDASVINPKTLKIPELLIFPLWLRDVFFHVMNVENIKYVVCEQEADQEIAIVARYLNVPVLSYDSDFYIYNVAYIPLKSINLKSPITMKDGKPTLDCEMCKVGDFARRYKIKSELLPLLSTLLGNDYVKRSTFSRFFKNLSLHKRKTRVSLGQVRIYSLIEWLQNEDFHSAVTKVLDRFKMHQRERILNLINKSCKAYAKKNCNSLYDLDIVKFELENESEIDDDDDTDSDSEDSFMKSVISKEQNVYMSNYPVWFLNLMKLGKISPRYAELLKFQIYISSPQVENIRLEDAFTLSFPILRYSFDLITKFKYSNDIVYVGRVFKKVNKIPIKRTIKMSNSMAKKLTSDDIAPSHFYFFYFLEQTISKSILNFVKKGDSTIQILLITIIWIKSQNSDKVLLNDSHIICLLLYGIISAKMLNTLNSKKIYLNIPNEELKSAVNVLSAYFKTNEKITSSLKLYDINIVHEFAQIHCCLQQINYLNVLTSEPLNPCIISQTYNGTFLYNFYNQLNKKDDVISYVCNLLKDSPILCNYIIQLVGLVNSVSPKRSRFSFFVKYIHPFLIIILFMTFFMCYFYYNFYQ